MRTNGFQSPHNAMQISTWILLPALILHFGLFVTPTLPIWLSIPLTVIFGALAIASIYYTYVTTKTDSMDERLYEHLSGQPHPNVCKRQAKEKGRRAAKEIASKKSTSTADDTHDEDEDKEEEVKYCWVCQTEVHVHSMHCKYCDKCVSHFDHHCMWLNTCIGAENYGTFFKSVWCITLLTSVHLLALILFYIGYFNKSWGVRERSDFLHEGSPEIVLGFNLAVGVFVFAIVAMVVQLLMFHRGLKRDGMTTYQFIMQDSQEKRDKITFNARVRERRNLELSTNRLEGGGFWARTHIQMGRMKVCRPCDPVRKILSIEKAVASEKTHSGKDTDDDFLETPKSEKDEKEEINSPKTTFEKV